MRTTQQRYSIVLRTLHWGIATLIVGSTGLGLYLGLQDGTAAERWYDLHKATGVVIFALVVLRIVWRLGAENELAIVRMPLWQHRVARSTHVGLYVLMVLIPVTGYVSSSAAGYPIHLFGFTSIPPLIGEDRQAYDLFREIHRSLNYVAIALISLHVAAVAKHHLADGRDVLSRML